jgi:hypothetical protein
MRLFVLCSLIVMGGCAANPGPAPGSDAAAASPHAAASPQAATSAPAAAPSPAAQPAAQLSKVNLPPGFKPTRISGELFYCRKMVVLGSRFPKQLCLNEDQLKEHIEGNEAMKRNKDEVSRLCTTKDGCAWN